MHLETYKNAILDIALTLSNNLIEFLLRNKYN